MRLVCWGVVFEIFVAGVAPMGWWVLLVVDVVFHCLGLTGISNSLRGVRPHSWRTLQVLSSVFRRGVSGFRSSGICMPRCSFFGRARTSGNGDIV